MDTHTPTPWEMKLEKADKSYRIFDCSGGSVIAYSADERNAAFIVRACNQFDKMLRQLKTIRLLYEKEMGILNTQELDALIAECEK